MLILKQYGITLKRVVEGDLEEIRFWRNQNFISENMIYREEISKQDQLRWFQSINNKLNYYFIIINDEGDRIGVINSKDVDLQKGEGEGGIFIWNQEVWNTQVPSLASLVLLNFSMLMLNSFKCSKIKVLKANSTAIKYNQSLGYVITNDFEQCDYLEMKLTKNSYLEATSKLRMKLSKIYKGKSKLVLVGEKSHLNIDEINELLV